MWRANVRAWVALGSNLGDRRAHLESAIERLRSAPDVRIVRVSHWHETEPVGGPAGQGPYLNGAVELSTSLTARELFTLLQSIEHDAGRRRELEVRHGPRTLDLDLLFHGDERVDEPDLQVPHPSVEERTFVLLPLAEIAPELRLPGSGLSVAARLAQLRTQHGLLPRR